MDANFTKDSTTELRRQLSEWAKAMFTAQKGKADINSVMLYSPLIQMVSNELSELVAHSLSCLKAALVCVEYIVLGFLDRRFGPIHDPLHERERSTQVGAPHAFGFELQARRLTGDPGPVPRRLLRVAKAHGYPAG